VRDVVRAYQLLLEKGVNGELYNVCTGKGYSLAEIIDMFAKLLRISITTKIDFSKIRPNDNKVIIGNNAKIIEHTGWYPDIPLMQSLQDLVFYWKSILGMEQVNYNGV
jgi:GDP-4-dehydro-6-deoxy-D-mannose reductase